MNTHKQITVFVGSYGSGKTEISLNRAIQSAQSGKKTALVDLDVVNPYFRSGFHKELLDAQGVHLISSSYFLEAADVPVVTAEVNSAFDGDYDTVIFDVGGDPVGATALGQYKGKFDAVPFENLNILFVVNTLRPLTMNADDICEMIGKIESCSRLRITGLVNNTNLIGETAAYMLAEGEEILKEVALRTGIPEVSRIYCDRYVTADAWNGAENVENITLYTHLNWLDFDPAASNGI